VKRRATIFKTNKHPKRRAPMASPRSSSCSAVDRILERGRLLRLDGPCVRTKHLLAEALQDERQQESIAARVLENRRQNFWNAQTGEVATVRTLKGIWMD